MSDISVIRLPCPDHPEERIGTQVERKDDGTTKTTVIEPCPKHGATKKAAAKSK